MIEALTKFTDFFFFQFVNISPIVFIAFYYKIRLALHNSNRSGHIHAVCSVCTNNQIGIGHLSTQIPINSHVHQLS